MTLIISALISALISFCLSWWNSERINKKHALQGRTKKLRDKAHELDFQIGLFCHSDEYNQEIALKIRHLTKYINTEYDDLINNVDLKLVLRKKCTGFLSKSEFHEINKTDTYEKASAAIEMLFANVENNIKTKNVLKT